MRFDQVPSASRTFAPGQKHFTKSEGSAETEARIQRIGLETKGSRHLGTLFPASLQTSDSIDMKPSTRIPGPGLLRVRLAQLVALWLLLYGSAIASASTGKPPTQPRLSPSGLRLTDCSVQVPTNFKAEWSWTDGAILGMVELWETTGRGGRQTHLVKKRDQAKAPEVSATLDKNSWYRLKVRNYTAHDDVWLDVDFTTGPGLLPNVSLNTTAIQTCAGSAFELVANIDGCNTTVQWYLDGQAIDGARTPTLRRNASLEDSGHFMVVVSTPAGKGSATCNVEVFPRAEIITQPESQEVTLGDPIELTVEAAGEALRYQWYKNGSPIPGADQPEFSIPRARSEDAGSYHVLVGSRCGNLASQPAPVIVNTPALEVRILPIAEQHCPDEPIQLLADITGVNWQCQWYHNDAPIPNATSPTLQFRVSESTSGDYTIKVFSPTQNAEDSKGIVVLPAVSIREQPQGTLVEVGETIELFVEAEGETDARPLSYQWFKNKIAIPGATKDSLSIPNAQTADAGSYSVAVSGQCGSIPSVEVSVTVVSPIVFAVAPTVRFQRTESGLLVSWPKEFVLGEQPGLWQLVASIDLDNWYPAFYEEDKPLDLGNHWGVTIPWIDAGANPEEAGFESETQEPTTEFFRLTPGKPEAEVQE